jgi:hypothetical protein
MSANSRKSEAYSEVVGALRQPLVRFSPDTPPFILKPEFQTLNLTGFGLSGLRSYRPTWAMQPGGPVRTFAR